MSEGTQEYAINSAKQSAGGKIKWEPVEPGQDNNLAMVVEYNKKENMWKFAKE